MARGSLKINCGLFCFLCFSKWKEICPSLHAEEKNHLREKEWRCWWKNLELEEEYTRKRKSRRADQRRENLKNWQGCVFGRHVCQRKKCCLIFLPWEWKKNLVIRSYTGSLGEGQHHLLIIRNGKKEKPLLLLKCCSPRRACWRMDAEPPHQEAEWMASGGRSAEEEGRVLQGAPGLPSQGRLTPRTVPAADRHEGQWVSPERVRSCSC